MGVLTEVDRAVFAAYCQSYARWKEAQEHIDSEGSTFETDKGYQQQTPWFSVSGLVFDEIHTQPNRQLYDVLTKGSSDARQNPLHFIITTAGNDRHSIAFELHTKVGLMALWLQSWHLIGRRGMKARVPGAFMMKGDFWFCKVRNYIKTNLTKQKCLQFCMNVSII